MNMNKHCITINGKLVIKFIMYIVFNEICTEKAEWIMIGNTYNYIINCTDEQLTYIKLVYGA